MAKSISIKNRKRKFSGCVRKDDELTPGDLLWVSLKLCFYSHFPNESDGPGSKVEETEKSVRAFDPMAEVSRRHSRQFNC
jgi:hypothetical protein